MPRYCPQERFLRECRDFKAALQFQAHALESGPRQLSTREVQDLFREMDRVTAQLEQIISLAINMVMNDPTSDVIALNPPFWAKERRSHYSRFEQFFDSIKHTIAEIERDCRQGSHAVNTETVAKDLRDIASVLETNLRL